MGEGKKKHISLLETDIRILRRLQEDCSISVADLAEKLAMSASSCWRRIQALTDSGIISRRVALVDRRAVELNFVVYAFVKLGSAHRQNIDAFETAVQTWPEVLVCELITGAAADVLIKVVTSDIEAYDDFLRHKLLSLDYVADVQSRIVVSTIKETTALPVTEFE